MIIVYIFIAVFALAICLGAGRIGRVLQIVDVPDGARKLHARATPLVGGIAVSLPFVAMAIVLGLTTVFSPLYFSVAAAVFGFLVLGFLDDRTHLPPSLRLVISAAAMILMILIVPGFEVTFLKFTFLEHPIFFDSSGRAIGILFTVFCLVGFQNAVNMADGKNGLVMGMTLVWVLALIYYAPAHVMPLLIAFLIALIVAMPFNLRGRLFLGDSGTYSLSIAVGLLAIYVHSVAFDRFSSDAVAMLFLIPVIDVIRLMASRALKGTSPFKSGRDHLHHILLNILPLKWALSLYLFLVGLPILLTALAPDLTLLWAVITLVLYGLVVATKYRHGTRIELAGR
jgi:UDP-GlcNAc:undecaprenyl-phosphate GlcNAc-1-phosphate transferase